MSRRQYHDMDNSSGVGVLDKAAIVLGALEAGPATLAGLVQATGLARPTAHRLAVALEHHRLVARDLQGRFVLGPRLAELAAAAGEDRLLAAAGPVLTALRDTTGESGQLYRRQGEQRICVAAAERLSGLRDTVPVGCGAVDDGRLGRAGAARVGGARAHAPRPHGRASSRPRPRRRRRRGWAQSVGEREAGVASVSAPVRGPAGQVVAAVSRLRADRAARPRARPAARPGRGHRRGPAHRGAAPQRRHLSARCGAASASAGATDARPGSVPERGCRASTSS